ncbi:hypothetical protein F383_32001 [Gossypium arboreum]|uniref:Uncharacterized protein n=1 Tax=Gossypium arboreum TaxID=29729 RepID=A0A0B0PLB3_GOSAR|nr:hypothetical protein F383_32001 [Gossypium arboreum]
MLQVNKFINGFRIYSSWVQSNLLSFQSITSMSLSFGSHPL